MLAHAHSEHRGPATQPHVVFRALVSLLCFSVAARYRAVGPTGLPTRHAARLRPQRLRERRPLSDALSLGYKGAEADVFLIDGELRLGHDRHAAERGATFEAQYLAPLRSLVARSGRSRPTDSRFCSTWKSRRSRRPDAL